MVTTRPTAPTYIIKRPRLTKLLDESEARIILLCAPAGYGKTTLAREWVETRAERVAWYSGGLEMADPAALATRLCGSLAGVGLFTGETARIAALAVSDAAPPELGEAIAAGVPQAPGGLLVLDDYQHAVGSAGAEQLLSAFITSCSLRVLITSRLMPTWLTPRMEVYGEALHIDTADLTFTTDEADEVLKGSRPEARALVVAQAKGWPAVIGLAARRGDQSREEQRLPTDLFRFLADDLFERAPDRLRDMLFLFSLCGADNLDVLEQVVGPELDSQLISAFEQGFITQGLEQRYEIHPLINAFLVEKLRTRKARERESLVATIVTRLASVRRWDDCLRTLRDFPTVNLIEDAFAQALSDLVALGRMTTIRSWIELAESCRSRSPLLMVAEAELALRERDHEKSIALAETAAGLLGNGELAAHAHLVAARAAHLQSDRATSQTELGFGAHAIETTSDARLRPLA